MKQLAADLAETMYAAPGAGLAANQIGVCKRVVVIDVSENKEEEDFMQKVRNATKEFNFKPIPSKPSE